MRNMIKRLRKEAGLRQEDMAKELGVSRQTIIAIENDKYNPTLELAMKIARLLGRRVEEIFFLEEGKDERNGTDDNAPVWQMETEEKYFSFVVKTDFTGSCHRFDQCGIVMYLDSENWLKGSVEYENDRFQHLGSVVTNNGYSDWATTEIDASVKTMWYRLSRREDDYCIECSSDGITFHQMRVCRFLQICR